MDWRWGERFLMSHLIDGDALSAANNGAGNGLQVLAVMLNPTFEFSIRSPRVKKF
ncbi:hypothetical protein O9992_22675 [Vibrio lentus]|nr:hypothetical protein [Vibrio lentus]